MKVYKVLFLLFLITAIPVFSQIKGKIVDSKNNPIPYVSIAVANENIGTTSEEDGSFILNIKEEKEVVFSALGYENKILKSSQVAQVQLISKTYDLDEVVLTKYKNTKQIVIGEYKSGGFRYNLSINFNAIYFQKNQYLAEYPFIKKLKFRTKSRLENAKIRLKIIECNTDFSLGDAILKEEKIIEVKKGNNANVIDLSDFKLKISENGFYVVFEKLLIQENKFELVTNYKTNSGGNTNLKTITYEPDLEFVPSETNNYRYSGNGINWFSRKKIKLDNPNGFTNILMKKYDDNYLVPSVEITLSN